MLELMRRVREALFCGAFTDPLGVPKCPGIYAVFLRDGADLKNVPLGQGKLIYIGIASNSLFKRSHFRHPASSSSTLRRSLGALEVVQGLRPRPRGHGKSPEDFTHYWFDGSGEADLSCWMTTYLQLRYTCHPPKDKLGEIEKTLIRERSPVLNIQNADHKFVPQLLKLRSRFAKCAKGWPSK